MKKRRFLIAFCLGLVSVGIGLIAAARGTTRAKADDTIKLNFDENDICEFGSYPQTIDFSVDPANPSIVHDDGRNIDTIDGTKYRKTSIAVDLENNGQLSDGTKTESLDTSAEYFFKFEPLKWKLINYDEKNKICTLIVDNIVDREVFDNGSITDYNGGPALEKFLNSEKNGFYHVAFSDAEKESVLSSDFNGTKHKVLIPSKADFEAGSTSLDLEPSDYAICKNLSSHLLYNKAPMWTSDISDGRIVVKWNTSEYTNCLVTDPKIGVAVKIDVHAEAVRKSGGGGGGGSTSTPVNINFNGNVPMLIIGLILMVGGGTTLVILILKWNKNIKTIPGFKCKWHCYLIMGLVFIVCIVGLNLYAYGTVLKVSMSGFGPSKHIYGLYISCTYLDDDDGSEDWDWADITHGVYALTKDGKVYHYIGNWPVGKQVIREPGEGSYVVKGNQLTITYPESWRTFSFEHSPMTYKIEYGQYWEVSLTLDGPVSFAESVPPPVSGSGIYNMNYNSYASNHNPDGRDYYTKGELGY